MKANNQLIIPSLNSEEGTLRGGFTSLSEKQMTRIKGGANAKCVNNACGASPNSGCTNTSLCDPRSNTVNCKNSGDCGALGGGNNEPQ